MINGLLVAIEERLASREDWLRCSVPFDPGTTTAFHDAPDNLAGLSAAVVAAARDRAGFFTASPPPVMASEASDITWSIKEEAGMPCTGATRLRFYPARARDEATIIVPHMNTLQDDYARMCQALQFFGTSTVRYTLPFHDGRTQDTGPGRRQMVSANLGLTIACVRQSVIEVIALAQHLRERGYRRINLVGISLGTCTATIAGAISELFDTVSVFLMADDFASVVWRGRATRDVRAALDGNIALPALQDVWDLLHPYRYADLLAGRKVPVLLITGEYDTVMPPDLTANVVRAFRSAGVDLDWRRYQCGHYGLAYPPFSLAVLHRLLAAFKRARGNS